MNLRENFVPHFFKKCLSFKDKNAEASYKSQYSYLVKNRVVNHFIHTIFIAIDRYQYMRHLVLPQ